MAEQNIVVKPFASRSWRWFIARKIAEGLLKQRDNIFTHRVIANRWPYVDPLKEAKADEQQLKNGTTTRTAICARQGDDFIDVITEREKEEKIISEKNIILDTKAKETPSAEAA